MSRLRRLFVEVCQTGDVELAPDEAHYAKRVLRLADGEDVELFDRLGRRGRGRLQSDGRRISVELREIEPSPPPPLALTVGVAAPKGERADWLVEKAAELGVGSIAWIRTERSVVDLGAKRIDRLRRVALAAARQSDQPRLMQIEAPLALTEFVTRDFERRIVAHPGGPSLATLDGSPVGTACVLVGPEGGFTDAEICSVVDAGYTEASLGDSILRVETAVVAAAVLSLSLWVNRSESAK